MKEHMELIKAHPAFEGVDSEEDILWLQKCMQAAVVKHEAGSTVFAEGEEKEYSYLLLEGTALAVYGDGRIEKKEGGSFLFETPPEGRYYYTDYTLLADSDIILLSMRSMRIMKLCNFRCLFHAKMIENISRAFSDS